MQADNRVGRSGKPVSGLKVMPGDPLCSPEEFSPGDGTYVEEGVVRSAILGVTVFDYVNRRVKVTPHALKPRVPRNNDTVIGIVETVRDDFAFIKIVADGKGEPYSCSHTGILHVSQASISYVKSLKNLLLPGDIVKVKVVKAGNPVQVSMKSPHHGVIAAYCSKCGDVLVKGSKGILKCMRCGNIEKRKVARGYLYVMKK